MMTTTVMIVKLQQAAEMRGKRAFNWQKNLQELQRLRETARISHLFSLYDFFIFHLFMVFYVLSNVQKKATI